MQLNDTMAENRTLIEEIGGAYSCIHFLADEFLSNEI